MGCTVMFGKIYAVEKWSENHCKIEKKYSAGSGARNNGASRQIDSLENYYVIRIRLTPEK